MIGNYTVHQGDSTKVLKKLQSKIDLFLFSPPYLSGSDRLGYEDSSSSEAQYIQMLVNVAGSCWRLAREDGLMIINLAGFSQNPMLPEKTVIAIESKTSWKVSKKLTWNKPTGFPVHGICSTAESVYVFSRDRSFRSPNLKLERINKEAFKTFSNNDKYHKKKYDGRKGLEFQHNATFPMELVRLLINTFASHCHKNPGEFVVCDPFAGTGTTLVMAILMGLNAIGIDREPEYVKWMVDRLANIVKHGGIPSDEGRDLLPSRENWERDGVYTPSNFQQLMESYIVQVVEPCVFPRKRNHIIAQLQDFNPPGKKWQVAEEEEEEEDESTQEMVYSDYSSSDDSSEESYSGDKIKKPKNPVIKRRYNGVPGAYRKFYPGEYVIAVIAAPNDTMVLQAWEIERSEEQYQGDHRFPDRIYFIAYTFQQDQDIFSPIPRHNGIQSSFDTTYAGGTILTACASLNNADGTFKKTHLGPAHTKMNPDGLIHARAFGPDCPYCAKQIMY